MLNKAHIYGFIAGVLSVSVYHYVTGKLPSKKTS